MWIVQAYDRLHEANTASVAAPARAISTKRRRKLSGWPSIPAALLLAAGVYLPAGFILPGNGTDGIASASLAAGMTFIVGLYVKLALRALRPIADLLYGGIKRTNTE